MSRSTTAAAAKSSPVRRGRPPKFGRPGHAVSLTLPDDALRELNELHPDTGWAIVKLLERGRAKRRRTRVQRNVQLASIGPRRSLIVVGRATFKALPGVNLIPFTETHAFLALEPGRGMSDLELAVIDRLADTRVDLREREALQAFRTQLAAWRRDQSLRFHSHSIIVVEDTRGTRSQAGGTGRRSA